MRGHHSYNLLSKRWIPVTWRNDVAEPKKPKVGITELLHRSHEIRCISHTSPFIEFGLHRLLITIILDAYTMAGKRPTVGKMRAMVERGFFNDLILREYLETYEEGFDLWSDKHPFLQMSTADGKSDEIAKMIAPIPSGTKITFWHHYFENETSLDEGEAARELCATFPFCFDYAPKDICTIGGDPPLYILVYGESVFETLIFNLPRPSGRLTVQQEIEGGPLWRSPVDNPAVVPASPTITQGWTWPVRQIHLRRSEASSATATAVNISGASKTLARGIVRGWRDPNAGVITDSTGLRHIRPNDLFPDFGRSTSACTPAILWRDLVPMCFVGSEGEVLRGQRVRSRPEVITNALRIMDGRVIRFAAYGFIDKGGKNKVFRTWFRSVLIFPTEVARDSRFAARAIDTFRITQKVADVLQTALRMIRAPSEVKKTARKTTHRAEIDTLSRFWQCLELPLSGTYLEALGGGDQAAEQELWDVIRREARDAFTRATGPQRRTADGLFRIANATNWFEGRLKYLLPKPGKEKCL
jgi:CRISPR type I-E-associated protein CasA/Cse1